MRRYVTGLLLCLVAVVAAADQRLTVVFKQNAIPAAAVAAIQAAGGTVTASAPEIGFLEVTGPVALLNVLGTRTDVAAASPDIEFKLPKTNAVPLAEGVEVVDVSNADLYNWTQWDIKQVTKQGASFALGTGSHQTVVGIVDTGVSQQHPDVKANLLGGRNFVADGPGGTLVSTDIEDKNGHGTHVAGSIAGNGRILGVGPDLGFRSYRVFGAEGGAPTSLIVRAMIAAVNDHVDVISMSIGGYDAISPYTWTDPDTGTVYKGQDLGAFLSYRRAVQYAIDHGVLVVAAAGNEGFNAGNPSIVTAYMNWAYGEYGYDFKGAGRESPGTVPGVITVSATGPDTSLASYSNYGNQIDVTAPGGDFKRYPAPDYYLDMCLSSSPYYNDEGVWTLGYAFMAGTSMATPKVSAVAALIIDQAKAHGQTLSPAQVSARVKQTSVDLGKPGVDAAFGSGIVNAFNALSY